MKKQLKYMLLALLLMCVGTGCADFLEEYNPSAVTDEFYNTKEGQEKLLVSVYSRFRDVFNTGELQYYGTDLYMAVTEDPSERMFNGYDKTFNSTAPVVGDYWKNLYKIVQECNTLLHRCTPQTAGGDYASLAAQGRFLRVLAYYYLVETFGDVPLLTEENESLILKAERTPESAVYAFMLNELEDIKEALAMTTVDKGRVTDAAVRHLLGKLYLTRAYKPYAEQSDFADAASAFESLLRATDSYSLQPSFASLFDENNQGNSEVIWAIQYGLDKNYVGGGNPQQALFGFNIVALEPDMFVKAQEDYSAMERRYWIIPKVHELFTDPEADARYDATFQREFYINNPDHEDYGKLGIYFPRWNDKSGINYGAKRFYPFRENDDYSWYPQSTALPVMEAASDRMPILRKFKDTKIQWGAAGSREDVVFRLGDTYLLCAEACLGAGDKTRALELVNEIRRRAAVDAAAYEKMKLTELTINILMDERARELLGEHDRWFDLKRTQTLLTRVPAYNPLVVKYGNLNKNHLVRPIPQDERNKVEGLTQNEGY